MVAAAGERYDGHPDLDSVDISSVGYWGEGWSDYMPAFEVQKKLMDIWLEAFKRTPLLMNFDQEQALAYGTRARRGLAAGLLGRHARHHRRARWCHMLDFYPQQIVRAGIQDVWQRSPVSLETCWVPGGWKEKGYDLDYILAQALRWHVSSVNIKSSAIPPEWKKAFDEFQKKMGYRFILRRLEYPNVVLAGTHATAPHVVAERGSGAGLPSVRSGAGIAFRQRQREIKLPVDVRKWLPGDAVFDGTIYIPETLKPGSYRLRVALLDPRTGTAGHQARHRGPRNPTAGTTWRRSRCGEAHGRRMNMKGLLFLSWRCLAAMTAVMLGQSRRLSRPLGLRFDGSGQRSGTRARGRHCAHGERAWPERHAAVGGLRRDGLEIPGGPRSASRA